MPKWSIAFELRLRKIEENSYISRRITEALGRVVAASASCRSGTVASRQGIRAVLTDHASHFSLSILLIPKMKRQFRDVPATGMTLAYIADSLED